MRNEIIKTMENLSEESFPNLKELYQANPESVIKSLENMKKNEPEINLETFCINLESDLAYI